METMTDKEMLPLAVLPPDTTALEAKISGVIAEAEGAVVETLADYNRWKEYKDGFLAEQEKAGKLLFDGTKDKPGPTALLNRAHKAMTEMRDRVVGRYTVARNILSPKLGAWWNKDQERQADERRRREEEARKAEADRLKAEGASKKEIKAVETGKTPVALPPEPAKPETVGRKPRTYYSARCTDLMALVAAVFNKRQPLRAVVGLKEAGDGSDTWFESAYLNNQAEQLKDDFAVPGCRLVKETRG